MLWARRLNWKEVAEAFQTTWDNVFRSVKIAVACGLKHRDLENVFANGIDEIAWRKKGDKFLTLVYRVQASAMD